MRNPVCQGRLILSPPRWPLPPSRIPSSKTLSSVVWAFYDPDGTGYDLMRRSPPCLFGKFVKIIPFESRAVLVQCSRCLRLCHSVERCRRPRSTIICGLCGGPHTHASHPYHCPTQIQNIKVKRAPALPRASFAKRKNSLATDTQFSQTHAHYANSIVRTPQTPLPSPRSPIHLLIPKLSPLLRSHLTHL